MNIYNFIIIWMLWTMKIQGRIIAFDCNSPTTNISAISLREVAPCPDPDLAYNVTTENIEVIEKNKFEYNHVYSCLIEITRVITNCGAFSHSSIIEGGILTYVNPVGAEECRKIHQYREYRGLNGHIINNIKSNTSTTFSITLAGILDDNGRCEGTQFIDNGKTYKNVVVSAAVKIILQDYVTKVELDTNEIKLRNEVTCPYNQGYCLDYIIGETIWNPIEYSTCEKYRLIYNGRASLVQEQHNQNSNLYLVVEENQKIFAIKINKKEVICGHTVWTSEHPRLLIVRKNDPSEKTPWKSQQKDADLLTYLNSKFLYIEQSFKRNLNHLITQTIHRRCLLHREILQNRLLMAPIMPNSISSILKNKLGYIATVAGEVLYIMKCTPIMAEIRRETRCFAELPVKVHNTSMFMSPNTRILQKHGEEIECNAILPPMYFIENKWVGFDPYPTVGITPQQLKVNDEEAFNFDPIKDLGSGGIYTYKEIQKAQEAMIFNMERPVLHNILIKKLAGHDISNQGYSTLTLFDAKEIEEITQRTLKKIYGWFTTIGEFSSGLIGMYIIFRLIKFVLETLLNAMAIHKIQGCSCGMFASFWDTLTLFMLQRKYREYQASNSRAPASDDGTILTGVESEASDENREDGKVGVHRDKISNTVVKQQNWKMTKRTET